MVKAPLTPASPPNGRGAGRAGRNVVLPNGCLVSVRYIDDDDMAIVNIFRGRKLLISDIVDKETIDQFIDSYDYSTQYIHIP